MSAVTQIGHVEAIFRYPVKSMAGEQLDSAQLGWHGLEGDRRLALRRVDDRSGFPWLSATKLPELLLFAPRPGENSLQAATRLFGFRRARARRYKVVCAAAG
jgi:uncharacterized protein YcbX